MSQTRAGIFQTRLGRPDHIAQGLGFRPTLAATDFSIDHTHTECLRQFGDFPDRSRMHSAMNRNHTAGLGTAQHPTFFKRHSLELGIVDHNKFDDLAMGTNLIG